MKEQFNVTYYITGENRQGNGSETLVFKAKISFECNPKDYGNGYYMGIESKGEAFGFQAYDIRYDTEFSKDRMLEYIVRFYANRYNGKNGSYKLTGIRVHEAEFDD